MNRIECMQDGQRVEILTHRDRLAEIIENITRLERSRVRAASELAATIAVIVAILGSALSEICESWAESAVGIDGRIQNEGTEIRAIQIARAVVVDGDYAGAYDERGEEAAAGWVVLRFWETDIRRDADAVAQVIAAAVGAARPPSGAPGVTR